MNTKKIILAVAGGIVALALIITGITVAVKNINGKSDGNDSGSPSSSQSGGQNSDSSQSDNTSSEKTVSGGKVGMPTVKANTGKKVTVPIKLDKNPGLYAARLFIEYDLNALQYNGCDNGDILDECEDNGDNGEVIIVVNNNGTEDSDKNGTLVTLSFTVKDGAAKGDYEIGIADKSELCNADEKLVIPEISGGKITVE